MSSENTGIGQVPGYGYTYAPEAWPAQPPTYAPPSAYAQPAMYPQPPVYPQPMSYAAPSATYPESYAAQSAGVQPAYGQQSPYYAAPDYAVPGVYAAPSSPGMAPYSAPYQVPVAQSLKPSQGEGKAVAGLVLGIISMVAWILPFVGFPVAVSGVVLSLMGRRSSRRTMATWGLVLAIIGLVLVLANEALYWVMVLGGHMH